MGDLINLGIVKSKLGRNEIGVIRIGSPGVIDLEQGSVFLLLNLSRKWPLFVEQKMVENYEIVATHLHDDVRSMIHAE